MRRIGFLTVWLFLVLPVVPASALVGDSNGPFGLDGSIRVLGFYLNNYDFRPYFQGREADGLAQAVLRLAAAGKPADRLRYEAHLVQEATWRSAETASGGGFLGTYGGRTRYRALDEARDWLDDGRTRGALWLDRLNVKLSLPRADLTIGRQAITFGKAHFWNPLDVYLPFDPRQFDRDYKPGVDAVRLDVPLGSFSGFNLVGVFGRELDLAGNFTDRNRDLSASWYGSSVLARGYATIKGWDLAVQGGKIYGGWQIGAGAVGEVRGVQFRAEAAWFWAEDSPALPLPLAGNLYEDAFTGVLGMSYRFQNSLLVEAEVLYNGGGEDDRLETALVRTRNGALLHLGLWLAGFTASYELTPLTVGRLSVIQSLSDGSMQVQPMIVRSLADNAELVLGLSLNLGDRPGADAFGLPVVRSEFGSYPDYLFAEVKFYF